MTTVVVCFDETGWRISIDMKGVEVCTQPFGRCELLRLSDLDVSTSKEGIGGEIKVWLGLS